MAVKFKKITHVSLVNDDEDADFQGDSDQCVLISGDEQTKEDSEEREATQGGISRSTLLEDNKVGFQGWFTRGKWKFWKRKKRYEPNTGDDSDVKEGRKITVCGRTCELCQINSWRAIFLALFAFSAAMLISVLLSKLLPEPIVPKGAVASDSDVCANMAADILRKNGSAVDAAITAMLCGGVVHAESSGLGGGGFMVVRLNNGSVYSINFREVAPLAATEDMYHSNPSLSRTGGLAVAVPGELKGMELAHKLFGKLEWSALFDPVINLCRDGYKLTRHTEEFFKYDWDVLPENMRRVYMNEDGTYKKTGDLILRPNLAATLETIAANKTDAFYRDGEIAQSIIETVSSSGGILTLEDLTSYQVVMETPLKTQFHGHTFYAPPSPGGGPLLLYALSLLDHYHLNSSANLNLTYHRLVEALKFAFAERSSLGDPYCGSSECQDIRQDILKNQSKMLNDSFVYDIWSSISDERTFNTSHYHPYYSFIEDSGTSHFSVLSQYGDAVAVTTTINGGFGSKLMTRTGIILNNEMDDFSSPNITNEYGVKPSKANFIRPRKRPLSSTCPTIAVMMNKDGSSDTRPPLIITGASGGTRIPTAVIQVLMQVLVFEEPLSTATESKRLHHQLIPNQVLYEQNFPASVLKFLEGKGHKTQNSYMYAVVQTVHVDKAGKTTAHADSRKQGTAVLVNPVRTS